jgi:hypothetical protein
VPRELIAQFPDSFSILRRWPPLVSAVTAIVCTEWLSFKGGTNWREDISTSEVLPVDEKVTQKNRPGSAILVECNRDLTPLNGSLNVTGMAMSRAGWVVARFGSPKGLHPEFIPFTFSTYISRIIVR